MGIPFGTLKQIEEGRRPLPPLISLTGGGFADWLLNWFRCVEASLDERTTVEDQLMLAVLGRLRQGLP